MSNVAEQFAALRGGKAGLALSAGQIGLGLGGFAGSYILDRIGQSAQRHAQILQQEYRASTGGITPGQIVYGKAWVHGQIPYANSLEPPALTRQEIQNRGSLDADHLARQIYIVMTLAAHECEAFHRVRLDDTIVDPGTWGDGTMRFYEQDEGIPASGPYAKQARNTGRGRVETDQIAPLQCIAHLGASGQVANADLVASFTNWTAAHRGDGIAYAVLILSRYRGTRVEVWDRAGLPDDISVEVSGRKVYDPRLDSSPGNDPTNSSYIAWSDNPALCAADYCMHPLGWNRPASHIVWSSVVEWANHCDEVVATPANAKRFICNGVLYTKGQTHRQNLDRILNAGMGTSVFSEGKIKFVPFKEKTAIAGGAIVGDDNIRRVSHQTEYTGVRVRYGGDGALPAPHEVLVRATGGDPANDIELDLGMVDQAWRAQRVAYGYLKLGEAALTLECEGGNPMKQLASGDVMTLGSDRWGIASQRFRVDGMGWRTEGGSRITLREDDADIYADPDASFYQTIAADRTVALEDLEAVPNPTGVTATVETIAGAATAWIVVGWDDTDFPSILRYRVTLPTSEAETEFTLHSQVSPPGIGGARIEIPWESQAYRYEVEVAHITGDLELRSDWVS